MTRTYDPQEQPVLKGPWKALGADSKRVSRGRQIWLSKLDFPVAEEIRIDFQGTDDYVEASRFTPAYMKYLYQSTR